MDTETECHRTTQGRKVRHFVPSATLGCGPFALRANRAGERENSRSGEQREFQSSGGPLPCGLLFHCSTALSPSPHHPFTLSPSSLSPGREANCPGVGELKRGMRGARKI